MPEEGLDPLQEDSYVIKRQQQLPTSSMGFECLDATGKRIFEIRRSTFGTEYYFIDPANNLIGIVHNKVLGASQSFVLMDGMKNELATITTKIQDLDGLGQSFVIQDAEDRIIALATGDYRGASYEITKPDGQTDIAFVAKQSSGFSDDIVGILTSSPGAFAISINDKSFPRLVLLEFVVAVEMLDTMTSASGPAIRKVRESSQRK